MIPHCILVVYFNIDIIERKLSHDLICFENWCKTITYLSTQEKK